MARSGQGGVITVFLAMILLTVTGFICTCLESARHPFLAVRGSLITDAAVKSVFASYDRPLFEKYGLLFFAGAEDVIDEAESVAREYVLKNTSQLAGYEAEADLIALKLDGLEITSTKTAGDEDAFAAAVILYMELAEKAESSPAAAGRAGFGDDAYEKIMLVEYVMNVFDSYRFGDAGICSAEYVITGQTELNERMERMRELIRKERIEAWTALQDPELTDEDRRSAAETETIELLRGEQIFKRPGGEDTYLYEDFLRSRLYEIDEETLVVRMKEAIEEDICRVEPDFSFGRCIYGADFSVDLYSGAVFPFNIISKGYEFHYSGSYSYY